MEVPQDHMGVFFLLYMRVQDESSLLIDLYWRAAMQTSGVPIVVLHQNFSNQRYSAKYPQSINQSFTQSIINKLDFGCD